MSKSTKEMNIARDILEKHLNKDLDIKTYLKGSALTYEVVLDAMKEAINVAHCCMELPTKETINTVASNKALKYAYANEDTYEDYVKAIEEGADYVKNYLTKHE